MIVQGPRTAESLEIVARVAVIAQTAGNANKVEQGRLKLSATDPVLRLERVRFQGDRPIACEKIVLSLTRFPGLQDEDQITSSIAEIAKRWGVALGQATERAEIARASKHVAAQLGIALNAPVMKLDRIVVTRRGEAVEWRVAFTIPDW